MKKIKKTYRLKILLLFLLIIPIMGGMSSCKKDKTLDLDIAEFSWELKEVRTNSNTFKTVKRKNHFIEDAFVLKFATDSIFSLNTSVNYAGGKCKIITKGNIKVYTYDESTKVGVANAKELELNQNLIEVFKEVTEYKVVGKKLVFKGVKGEVEFKK